MNKESAEKKIIELTAAINEHNFKYYVLAEPEISDRDFDMLLDVICRRLVKNL